MKASTIVRRYFPKADAKFVAFILWERTAFPLAGRDMIEPQIAQFAKACKLGKDVCGGCGNIFAMRTLNGFLNLCGRCRKSME